MYEIKPLEPNLVNDYLHFFDTEEHSDHLDEHKCYCVCWSSDDHRGKLDLMATANQRRLLAEKYVKQGFIQGYLAYDVNRVIGWCNTNEPSQCTNCVSWSRNMHDVPLSSNTKTRSIFCFAIANDYRRKGVASALLNKVIEDSTKLGYLFVEAYPKKKLKGMDDFEGPIEMYLKQGFMIDQDLGNYYIVKKKL